MKKDPKKCKKDTELERKFWESTTDDDCCRRKKKSSSVAPRKYVHIPTFHKTVYDFCFFLNIFKTYKGKEKPSKTWTS